MRGAMKMRLPSSSENERGAVAVIVALSLIAIFGLIVLTVDVGQLLYKRRSMVNASDAAALAAAQTCAGTVDSDSPESMADTFALDNVAVAKAGVTNIIDIAGCDGPPFGHVRDGSEPLLRGRARLQRPSFRENQSDGRVGTCRRGESSSDRRVHGELSGELRHPGRHR
jgi:hypothetical protein